MRSGVRASRERAWWVAPVGMSVNIILHSGLRIQPKAPRPPVFAGYNSHNAMLKQSEAIVLRTYPLREADLLVTLFTRAEGKLRGVAKAAKKSKRRCGGSVERLTGAMLWCEE